MDVLELLQEGEAVEPRNRRSAGFAALIVLAALAVVAGLAWAAWAGPIRNAIAASTVRSAQWGTCRPLPQRMPCTDVPLTTIAQRIGIPLPAGTRVVTSASSGGRFPDDSGVITATLRLPRGAGTQFIDGWPTTIPITTAGGDTESDRIDAAAQDLRTKGARDFRAQAGNLSRRSWWAVAGTTADGQTLVAVEIDVVEPYL